MRNKIKIVHVDDNPNTLQTIKSFVTSEIKNVEFEYFSKHENFLHYIENSQLEDIIIIVDFEMPERNGVELIDLIINHPKIKKYIIFSSQLSYIIQNEINRLQLKNFDIKIIDKLSAFHSLISEIKMCLNTDYSYAS